MVIEVPKINNEPLKENDWDLPLEVGIVEKAEKALLEKLIAAGWREEEVFDFVHVVFHEALVNAIAHGNLGISTGTSEIEGVIKSELENLKKSDPEKKRNREVHINIELEKDKITVVVRDEGKGFKHKEIIDPTDPENLLKPQGRGVLFMKALADSVTYNEKGNEVTLVKERKD